MTDSRDPVPAGQLVTYGLNFGRRAATGRCGAFSFNACNPRQLVIWLASVPAGQTVIVTMPPVVRADVPPGSVGRLVGSMREPSAPRRVLAVAAVTVGAGM